MTNPATGEPAPADPMRDVLCLVQSLLRRARRYWLILAVSVALGAVAFKVAPILRPPVYRSEVVLSVRETLPEEAVLGTNSGRESRRARAARLQGMVYSRPLLRALIDQEKIGLDTAKRLGYPRAIEDVSSMIRYSGGEGDTILLAFESVDPGEARRGAHRVGQLLLEQVRRETVDQATTTRRFLEAEEAKLAEQLHSKEREYSEFVSLHPEFALDRAQGRALGMVARPPTPEPAAAAAPVDPRAALRRQADRLRARLAQIRNTGPVSAAAAPAAAQPELTPESREAIANARRELQRARQELESRLTKYTPAHPDVLVAQRQVTNAEEQLRRVQTAAQSLALPPSPAATMTVPPVAPDTAASLERQLKAVEAALRGAPSGRPDSQGEDANESAQTIAALESQWAALSRAVDVATEQHESIRRRLFQAMIIDTAQTAGGGLQLAVIEDAVQLNVPFARGARRTGAAAALVVVLLGASIVLGLAYLDQRIMTEWDLARLGIAPIALVIPPLPQPQSDRTRA